MKKKVLILVQNLANGGAEHMAAETSKVFADKYEVLIVTYRPEIDYEYSGTYVCLNAAGERIVDKIINTFVRLYKIKKIKKDFKPDFCISFMPNANVPNVLTRTGEVVISSVRANPEYNVRRNGLTFFVRRTALNLSDYIVTPSLGIAEVIREFYSLDKKVIRTIYNTCNLSNHDSRVSETCDKCRYIYTVGRLSKEKGQWHLIKAFYGVHKVFPDIKLKIFGDGVMRDSLEKLANDLDISDSVVFSGFVNSPASEMEYGNIFVLTSATESFSNVLIEAMSSGQVCVSADCNYGPREILTGGNAKAVTERNDAHYGVLFPPFKEIEPNYTTDVNDDEMRLTDILCDLISKNELRNEYCRLGLERAKYFSFDRYRNEWLRMIEEIYDKKI